LFFGPFGTFFHLLPRFVGSVECPVWFELLCLVGLEVKSLLRRRRRLSDANLVNSCRIVWRDRSMPKGWLYDWVGMSRRRK
jgi:hypothetical protein